MAEMLEGLYLAHPRALALAASDPQCLVRADAPVPNKVAIVTGGGTGHLPVFLGYVGPGMLDGCAVGDVFQSPSSDQVLEVTRRVHGGGGVLYLYGNYGGDVMNFDMAAELAALEGIEVRTVLVADDVASAPPEREGRRRGVAGMVLAFKVAGARAEQGGTLEEVEAAARAALDATRTMGVALSPCILPANGHPTFTIPEGEMELGMGIHGEPGVRRGPLMSADDIAAELLSRVTAELGLVSGDRVAVLVNGLGATPPEELYLLYRRVHLLLGERGVTVHRAWVGEYATSLEMAGASLSVMKLDDTLAELLDAPASTPFFVQERP